MTSKDLDVCRDKIDRVDCRILKLLAERKKISETIAKVKLLNGLQVFDQEREANIMQECQTNAARLGLNRKFINSFMHLLLRYSKKAQAKIVNSYPKLIKQ